MQIILVGSTSSENDVHKTEMKLGCDFFRHHVVCCEGRAATSTNNKNVGNSMWDWLQIKFVNNSYSNRVQVISYFRLE